MDLSELRFEGSPNERYFLKQSTDTKVDDFDNTVDGWTFFENKSFEDVLAKFDGIASDAFFQHVSTELPWKCMESIKEHYKVMEKSKHNASSSSEKNIVKEDKRKTKKLIIKCGGETFVREY